MKTYDSAKIRNVVLLGQSGTGKTSLAEAILFKTGATTRRGQPVEGTSVLDSSPEEVKRRLTITMGFAPVEWNGHKINFIDVPGFADFMAEAEAGLAVADLAVILLNGTAGIEPDTERFFEMAQAAGKPTIFLVNQMDKDGANYQRAVDGLRNEFSQSVVSFEVPVGVGGGFKGVVDVVDGTAFLDAGQGDSKAGEIPSDMASEIEAIRGALSEAAAESDDALLEKYLEQGGLSPEEIHRGLRAGVHRGSTYPVLAVSAETSVGLDRFLEFLVAWGPSPLDAAAPLALREGQSEAAPYDSRNDGPPVTLVFKTYADERLGEYTCLRCYSGKLAPGDYYNPRKQTSVRVGALYALRGKERLDLEELPYGDIGATPRIKGVDTNDTIGSKDSRVLIQPIAFSAPLHTIAVTSPNRGDIEKITGGFNRLAELDPSLRVTVDSALRQTLISGMGDQHIDVQIERLRSRAKVECETKRPRIPFRETIQGTVDDIQGRYKKQTGGRGQYGDVHLKIEPLPRGGGFEFVDGIVGGVIPSRFIPAVEKGIRETMERGVLVGYPVVDVRTTLHFGSYHDVDSSEAAFKMAGTIAFKEGFMKCQPVLLEPIMKLEITVPDTFTGDIMGDMSSRRGRIQGMEPKGRKQVIRGEAPMAELFGYVASLRSMTQGRGRFWMEVSHYEEVPRDVMGKLVEALKKEMQEAEA